jgi:hypothetical protein
VERIVGALNRRRVADRAVALLRFSKACVRTPMEDDTMPNLFRIRHRRFLEILLAALIMG